MQQRKEPKTILEWVRLNLKDPKLKRAVTKILRKRQVEQDLKPHCITVTRRGSVIHFGDHLQNWRGYHFERRSPLRRLADRMRRG